MSQRFFATSPRHTEELVASELEALGASEIQTHPAGVAFDGSVQVAYRACLWSRVANRILFPLLRFAADSPKALYQAAREVPWDRHMRVSTTFVVDGIVSGSVVTHSAYASQVVKDAIADSFRDATGSRPSVDREDPDLRINLHIKGTEGTISLDFSGGSLHGRGYRGETGAAPLKENIAAAMLLRARWPELASEGAPLIDPMCGSGTLPIEAALIAGDVAPGLQRKRFGFQRWKSHDRRVWEDLLAEARTRAAEGRTRIPRIMGTDSDPRVIEKARLNVERAGLKGIIGVVVRDLSDLRSPWDRPGLIVLNPPYGQRLGNSEDLKGLYVEIGRVTADRMAGWKMTMLTAEEKLARATGLRARRVHSLDNGAVPCRLYHFDLSSGAWAASPAAARIRETPAGHADAASSSSPPSGGPASERRTESPERRSDTDDGRDAGPGAEMFANRLKKNLGRLSGWVRKEGIHCYRVYGQDMPEYKVAIDLFEGKWAHVQEYAAPRTVDSRAAERRLQTVVQTVPKILGIRPQNLFLKQRRKHGRQTQYERLGRGGVTQRVREGEFVFLVNFTDYVDTGLFLDHRITRQIIAEMALARPFLNLFSYTGTATVAAAAGGATRTVSVDSSNTYLEWAGENLKANGLEGDNHEQVRADCRDFLRSDKGKYGLIFLDPPTFSNSKRRREDFDVQRDHPELIRLAAQRLGPEGVILFSTNFRRFRMEKRALPGLAVRDITGETIPFDFSRDPRVHQCYLIRK